MNKQLSLLFIALMLIAPSVWGQKKSEIEKQLEKIGLQNVTEEIPGIEVYMVYATPYNFMGRVLYEDLDEAYLVPEAMEKLRKANELLNRRLLREIMTEAGWLVEPSEWWHFNAMPITEASQRLTVIK